MQEIIMENDRVLIVITESWASPWLVSIVLPQHGQRVSDVMSAVFVSKFCEEIQTRANQR